MSHKCKQSPNFNDQIKLCAVHTIHFKCIIHYGHLHCNSECRNVKIYLRSVFTALIVIYRSM